MTRHDRSRWLRCLVVWLGATGATALLLPWVLAPTSTAPGFAGALVDLMALAGAAACSWLWLLTSLTALDAARGRVTLVRAGVPAGVRRVVLAACGVALASGGLAVPAHADDGPAHPSVLTGLPLPDRPTTLSNLGLAFQVARATAQPTRELTPGRRHAKPRPRPGTVVVRPGDTLWAIARRHLSASAGVEAVGRACSRLYELNRAVIGDDPDLIRPGQRLRLPDLTQEDS